MQRPRRGCGFAFLIALLAILLLAVLAGAVVYYIYRSAPPGVERNYTRRTHMWGVQVQRDPEPPDTILPDYTAKVREKQALNPDTIGWLYIPDTGIDAPVLHTPQINNMNNQYLDHDFNGEKDARGACFADMRAVFGTGSRNILSPLTTLYAHSFREDPAHDSPFSPLKYYRDEQFAREHPDLYFSTQKENMAFEVIAVFEAHINLPYNYSNQPVAEFVAMLNAVRASSLYDYGAEVNQADRLLVLSTCAMTVQGHEDLDPYTTQYRFVIMGKLVPPGEATRTEAQFTVNPSPAPPDDFLHMGYN